MATQVRDEFSITEGRMLQFGTNEVVVGRGAKVNFQGLTVGGFGIFRGDGTPGVNPVAVATSGGVFTTFGDMPAINNFGNVVFAANLNGGGQGIFNGPNAVTNKVIRTGDALDDSIVTSAALASGALNDLGQVAFAATLADGRQGVYVAIPVPEPGGVLLIAGTALAAGGWWRRRVNLRTPG